MTDHREDIRDAAESHTQHARFALLADRDELPHAFVPSDDEPIDCQECGEGREVDPDDHAPDGFDPDEYADGLAGLLLEVDALTSPTDSDRWRVELLLTCGGPTVRVVVDSRWSTVEYHHSWGRGRIFLGESLTAEADLTMIELSGDDADVWREVAMMAAGVDA